MTAWVQVYLVGYEFTVSRAPGTRTLSKSLALTLLPGLKACACQLPIALQPR